MAVKDFSQDTTLLAEPAGDDREAISGFQNMLDGVEQSPDEADETEAVEQPAEEKEEVQPAPVVEGPSLAMKEVARSSGLPDALVDTALNDSQLRQWMDLAANSSPEAEPAVEAEPFTLELPEDEYPENDPVRKELTKLQSHFSTELSKVKQELAEAQRAADSVQQAQTEQSKQQQIDFQREFDTTLDGLGVESLGTTGKLSPANIHLRSATFNLMQELSAKSPGSSVTELAKRAAEELKFTSTKKEPERNAAIRRQAKSRLGSGPSKPAAPGMRSEVEVMQEYLDKMGG